jgi:hypothetical protein
MGVCEYVNAGMRTNGTMIWKIGDSLREGGYMGTTPAQTESHANKDTKMIDNMR